ncbi:PREDICTED: venom protein 302-like [Priapulus caudatus]|uniref:Venom protein 302-like n=1 Tax=Priapulus caudatus TaxID=37621 RepID=A0ABM1DUA9_PRICU|nr:PREDICTED: venom protein 302-like [Priapulus caudatus]
MRIGNIVICAAVLLTAIMKATESLSCAACEEGVGYVAADRFLRCKEPENCTVGTVPDVCNCCQVCAKDKGERCGGSWWLMGRCGIGLQCMPLTEEVLESEKRPVKIVGKGRRGTCKPMEDVPPV